MEPRKPVSATSKEVAQAIILLENSKPKSSALKTRVGYAAGTLLGLTCVGTSFTHFWNADTQQRALESTLFDMNSTLTTHSTAYYSSVDSQKTCFQIEGHGLDCTNPYNKPVYHWSSESCHELYEKFCSTYADMSKTLRDYAYFFGADGINGSKLGYLSICLGGLILTPSFLLGWMDFERTRVSFSHCVSNTCDQETIRTVCAKANIDVSDNTNINTLISALKKLETELNPTQSSQKGGWFNLFNYNRHNEGYAHVNHTTPLESVEIQISKPA